VRDGSRNNRGSCIKMREFKRVLEKIVRQEDIKVQRKTITIIRWAQYCSFSRDHSRCSLSSIAIKKWPLRFQCPSSQTRM
jgi:hypothetical protein